MRHGKKFNHLGRKKGHRRALLANLAIALIEHKRINTTLAKAKALKLYVEPLITKSKDNSTHSRRVVFSYLQNKEALKELFGPVSAAVGERPGGYTRAIRTGFRPGDASEMALIELVDFNTIYTTAKGESKSKKRRTRRGGSKGSGEAVAAVAAIATTAATAAVAEATASEEEE
ncbi:MAG: 50S ribosomal protein L17 [Saprospiraceae bacterium]|nr:50S ribosomal protein L17 [Saprospiraceae bacterium]